MKLAPDTPMADPVVQSEEDVRVEVHGMDDAIDYPARKSVPRIDGLRTASAKAGNAERDKLGRTGPLSAFRTA